MSLQLTSMLNILNLLDKGSRVTRESLADDFNVTPRTIDRYLAALKAVPFPIEYDPQKKSYVFKDNFRLSKAEFTPEEALVLSLARTALKKDFGSQTATVLDTIEQKIGVSAPSFPKHIVISSNKQSPNVDDNFRLLNHAIVNCQKVEITYHALYSNEDSCRIVDPYYLVLEEGIWQLRGYCYRRNMMRAFSLDMMKALRLLDTHYLPKPEIIAEEELGGAFGAYASGKPVTVVLRFMKEFGTQGDVVSEMDFLGYTLHPSLVSIPANWNPPTPVGGGMRNSREVAFQKGATGSCRWGLHY